MQLIFGRIQGRECISYNTSYTSCIREGGTVLIRYGAPNVFLNIPTCTFECGTILYIYCKQ